MFEILPTPIQECVPLLHDILRSHSNIMEEAASMISTKPKTTRPFVQLNSEEMSGEEVDQILGYAGIPTYDIPIGLPLEFEPIATERGLVFYTSNHLEGEPGKQGTIYKKHGALCLEAGGFPNQINMESAENVVLRPNERYRQVTQYTTGIR